MAASGLGHWFWIKKSYKKKLWVRFAEMLKLTLYPVSDQIFEYGIIVHLYILTAHFSYMLLRFSLDLLFPL